MISASRKFLRALTFALSAWLALMSPTESVFSRTTVGTGSIVGTVSDPSGAVISGALGVGPGVYSLGAPRQVEFGLRLTF